MSIPEYDVVVVGGGPAGCTTATLLAERGRKVLLVEREQWPRYHIGESLIPYTWFALNRLGVIDQLKRSACPKKYSVQFVSVTGRVSQPFYFFRTIEHECAVTWQVYRSEFDAMLQENARAKGVEVRHGVAVRDLIMRGSRAIGVRADIKGRGSEQLYAKAVVDATGRDALLSSRHGWKHRDADLNKVAIWSYYKGALRDPGLDEGATTVAYVPKKGWFWYIPLRSDIISVGVVAEPSYLYRDTRDPRAILYREVEGCTWIRDHVKVGQQVDPVRVTGEYTYHSAEIGGDGFCLVGDAFAFLDPLFSTGLFLALNSGCMVADTLHAALDNGDVTARTWEDYAAKQRHSVMAFRRLVTAFYDLTFSFREFLQEYPDLHPLVVDTLVGNVYKDLNPLYGALDAWAKRPTRAEIDDATA